MKKRAKLRNKRIENKRLSLWLPREQNGLRHIISGDLEAETEDYNRKTPRGKELLKILKLNHKNST